MTEQDLQQAAQQGQGKAQYERANRLAAKPDYPEAMRWIKQAVDQAEPLAAMRMYEARPRCRWGAVSDGIG